MFNIVISFEKNNLTPLVEALGTSSGNLFLSPETSKTLITRLMEAFLPRQETHEAEIVLTASRCSETRLFKYQEVLYIESVGNQVSIHRSRDTFEFYGKMYHIEKITDSLGFVRVHHGFIVSPEHIKSYDSHRILMDNGTQINIGKSYRQHFSDFMKAYSRKLN